VGEYAFPESDDITFDNPLLSGALDVGDQQSLLSIGVRYRFQ
jgi:hypothetical protein